MTQNTSAQLLDLHLATWIWALAFGPFAYPERESICGLHLPQGISLGPSIGLGFP
ncbi:unnamed protein product [Arabidopsis halleri]